MNSLISSLNTRRALTIVGTGVVVVGAIVAGRQVSLSGFGARELIIVALGLLMAILAAVPDERLQKWGLALWILSFGFGWRTVHLAGALTLHPSEALVWLLFFAALLRRIVNRTALPASFPAIIGALMLLGTLGLVTAVLRGRAFDVAMAEAKVVFSLLPAYYIVQWLISSRADWERAVGLAVLVAAYISGLGLLDLLAPGLSRAISGNPDIATVYISPGGFSRVGFIFYGNFSAAFVIFAFFGLTLHALFTRLGRGFLPAVLSGLAVVAGAASMYLSGYRGLWYALVVFATGYAVVRRRAWLLVAAGLTSLVFFPAEFYYRFVSLYDPRYSDSSQFDRINRAQAALRLMLRSPLTGVGWAGSGYVHSDLIQIGANLGLVALLVFVLFILGHMWQTAKVSRRRDWIGEYGAALFATVCGLAVMFVGEGSLAFVQLMMPIWFVFAMSYKLIEFSRQPATSGAQPESPAAPVE